MSEQPDTHVPVEDIAAYAAGELDAVAAVAVEAHVLLCADCRADVEGLRTTAAALAAVPAATMPVDVAARIDAALAAEQAAAGAAEESRPDGGTVLPLRRHSRWASLSAAAAAVSLLVAVGLGLASSLGDSDGSGRPTTFTEARPGNESDARARTLASGHNYTRATVAGTVTKLLTGTVPPVWTNGKEAPAAGTVGSPRAAQRSGASPATAEKSRDDALVTPRGAGLTECLAALHAGGPAVPPLLLDYALFERQPALVVVLPTVEEGRAVSDRVDVWIVDRTCSRSDAKVLDFHRIDLR